MRARQLFFWLSLIAPASCGTSSTAPVAPRESDVMPMDAGDIAPANVVMNGHYSDERFLDMMSAHHQMALDMAKVAQSKAQHAEIQKMASDIISSQSAEIDAMRSMKQGRFGSSRVTLTMNPDAMDNDGVPASIADAPPFDQAFLDAMIPHHAGAVRMASVVRLRSTDPEIRALARSIIDAQSKEIGTMIGWRGAWYPDAQ
jgi:uncharacterized protein (DUF305 family)